MGLAGWSALVEGYVRLDVVLVAVAGVDAAAGEHAVSVSEDDLFARHRWRVVGVNGPVGVHIQDRADRDSVQPA